MARLLNKTKNQLVASDLREARGWFSRAKGLLGRDSLSRDEALWINPCTSIHTVCMKFRIDAAFVDQDLKVRAVYHGLEPWRLAMPLKFGVRSVIELAEGVLRETNTEVGDQLHVVA
ncbi:MAG TPA: DUF192 domain-containing protein [Bdellovibrionales bacterium]|nr:DUF192 domain-containing protein [Bdellovibrionales bacterium]